MKRITLLAILGLALGTVAAHADSDARAYLRSYAGRTNLPVPVQAVSPETRLTDIGAAVDVQFVVGIDGRPADVTVVASNSDALAKSVVASLKEWRFKPALREGKAVTAKVLLPFRVVGDGADSLAMK